MTIPPVRIHIPRRPKVILPSPHKPRADTGNEPEGLSGTVQDKKASQPEERLANALDKQRTEYEFRHTIGAPRGLPGWKEVDFVVAAFGQVYAIEVDTAFTHREKGRADVLHDAIVLAELKQEGMQVHPTVLHVDGESDLADRTRATAWVKQRFPSSTSFAGLFAKEEDVQTRQTGTQAAPPVQVANRPAERGMSTYRQQIKAKKLREAEKKKPAVRKQPKYRPAKDMK